VNDIFSCFFLVRNGVKQGSIVSHSRFVFIWNTFEWFYKLLTYSQVGCYVGYLCMAALVCTNDIVLLAPTARAMRELLNICDDFTTKFNGFFNAYTSKCLILKPFISRYMATDRLSSTNFCMVQRYRICQ